jgi:hypothetical protein
MLTYLRAFAFVCLFLVCATHAGADSIGDLLLPGDVIKGHAKIEKECDKCHKKFDKAAQSGLCKDCHKEIRKDFDEKTGFHGRMKEEKECKECHTDHKGRGTKIVLLDEKKLDHNAETDFPLKGGHLNEKVKCKSCHLPEKKFREAPSTCISCHKKNDKHKGGLGTDCAKCHTEKDWKSTEFDHDKTDFRLVDKHVDVKCKSCHINNKFKDTPKDCFSCHKKDDKHKGKFGPKCETCHVEKSWKEILFDHDKKTKYSLLFKHREAKCVSCHKGDLYKDKLKMDCNSCHEKDDKHKGKFGPKCETCHIEKGWKEFLFDHDKDTKYKLLFKHKEVKCASCHKGDLYKDKLKMECIACHEKDDKHKGQEGKKCESCHDEKAWTKAESFDHRQSQFPLTGKHSQVECKKCHEAPTFKDAKSDCWSCHEKKDTHKRKLGTLCENCHNTRDWRIWDFDHNKTKFKLEGGHKDIGCYKCHKQEMDKKVVLTSVCGNCHSNDDVHEGNFGRQCERCHEVTSWKNIKVGGRKL